MKYTVYFTVIVSFYCVYHLKNKHRQVSIDPGGSIPLGVAVAGLITESGDTFRQVFWWYRANVFRHNRYHRLNDSGIFLTPLWLVNTKDIHEVIDIPQIPTSKRDGKI